MRRERGIGLIQLIITLAILGFVGIMLAKCMPSYLEYFSVKKMFAAMEQNGETKGTVRDIRRAYELRNNVEDVKSVRAEDIEITKEAGETVLTATWSARVPLVYNINACLDFMVTTAK
jgi:Tfp pilus assembly protein PilE